MRSATPAPAIQGILPTRQGDKRRDRIPFEPPALLRLGKLIDIVGADDWVRDEPWGWKSS
jgi:hypothetical protein